jgi:hypothetical protein
MGNKKTAVELLYDTIIIFPESVEDLAHNARSFKKAQQMEKEQIINAVSAGWYYHENDKVSWMGEQYYDENFGH